MYQVHIAWHFMWRSVVTEPYFFWPNTLSQKNKKKKTKKTCRYNQLSVFNFPFSFSWYYNELSCLFTVLDTGLRPCLRAASQTRSILSTSIAPTSWWVQPSSWWTTPPAWHACTTPLSMVYCTDTHQKLGKY